MNREKGRDWMTVLLIAAAVKLSLIVWSLLSFPFEDYPHETWWSIWHRWDVRHFERIAVWGYWPEDLPPLDHEFLSHMPPGFPAMLAALHGCGLPLPAAGFIISFVCSV